MYRHAYLLLFAGALLALLVCPFSTPLARADCGLIEVDPGDDDWPDDDDEWPDGDDEWPEDEDPWSDEEDWDWEEGVPMSGLVVHEPTQKAVIAWNGREQIMVLATELKSSRNFKAVEITTFPSRPTVTKGDPDLFSKTMDLLLRKQGQPVPIAASSPHLRSSGGEVIETVKIGYHNIAVARVVNPQQFIAWAEGYVKRQLGPRAKAVITKVGKQVISQYLREGYRYWVFDLIDADTVLQPHVAIQYCFKTDHLYYPLKITRTLGRGNTHVELLVLTDGLLTRFRGAEYKKISVPHEAVTVSSRELRELNSEVADLFGSQPVTLRLWDIKAPIESFIGDLQASNRPIRRVSPFVETPRSTERTWPVRPALQLRDRAERAWYKEGVLPWKVDRPFK